MTTFTKNPISLYLPQDQWEALQALAERRGIAVEELIRQSVSSLLATAPDAASPSLESGPWAWPADRPIEEHPLWALVGLGESDVTDLAENHDKYLMEYEMQANQTWPVKSS